MAIIKTKQVHNSTGVQRVNDYICDKENDGEKAHLEANSDILQEIEYGTNEEKTVIDGTKEILVSGYLCTPELAPVQFAEDEDRYQSTHTKRNYETKQEISAIHAVMSFPYVEALDPRIVHQIGLEFAERLKELGVGEYKAVISTHMNTRHYHNHLLLNAYSTDGKHKFPDNKTTWKKLKDINDELSIKYGLPIIEEGKDYGRNKETSEEYFARNEGRSWKEQMRVDIDTAINSAMDYDNFYGVMEQIGYGFRNTSDGRPISISDGEHSIRLQRLGVGYTYEGILEKLAAGKMVSIREVEAKAPKEIYVRKVYVSKYSDSGRKRGIL